MKTRWLLIAFLLVLLLAVTLPARAMQSTTYKLDWLVPLTGGGGSASSTHYNAHITIGQSVIGVENSTNSGACIGFWCGAGGEYYIMLPLITR